MTNDDIRHSVVVRRLVATSHLVGVIKEAGRVLVPAYLGWAQPPHRPRLLSTRCACWGLWRSSILLVVVVGDDRRRVSPCRCVLSVSSLRCGRFIVLDGRGGWVRFVVLDGGGGWVASSMVVVGRKKRRGNV